MSKCGFVFFFKIHAIKFLRVFFKILVLKRYLYTWRSTFIFLFLAIRSMRIIVHLIFPFTNIWGFHCISAGKESACHAGDPDSIPGWGISAGEGIGYPLQYSWASLVAQLVKNPPAMWIRSLSWGDPLEMGRATHSSVLAWRIPRTVYPWGRKESDTTEHRSLSQLFIIWADGVALQDLKYTVTMIKCLPRQQVFKEDCYHTSIPTQQRAFTQSGSYKVKNKAAVKNAKFLNHAEF